MPTSRTDLSYEAVSLLDALAADPARAAILLDVDGVLAPIVPVPADAAVPLETRDELRRLHRRYALVGCVSVSVMEEGVGEFGMLVSDPGRRGAGIGSALVRHAEDWARRQGCRTMRLELLTPRHWKNPSKEFLQRWYARIGYAPQAAEPLERMYPRLVPQLATECDFTVWHKPLA